MAHVWAPRSRPSSAVVAAICAVVAGTVFGFGLSPAVAEDATAEDATAVVRGSAFSYTADVGLFGGPSEVRGYGQDAAAPVTAASPSVQCPAGGGTDSVTDPDGARAEYGPGVFFGGIWHEGAPQAPPSGPLTSTVECDLDAGGQVGASTSVALMPSGSTWATPGERDELHPGGAGPGPFVAEEVHSSCLATADGVLADVTIVGGVLETEYHEDSQLATVLDTVPEKPAPNETRTGTLDHVGDSYRIIFNERVENPDGSVTVNAVRLELLGPTAVGEIVIGSATCGVAPIAAAPDPVDGAVAPAETAVAAPAEPAGAAPPEPAGAAPPEPAGAAPPEPADAAPPERAGAGESSDAAPQEAPAPMMAMQSRAAQARDNAGGSETVGGAYNYYADVSLFGGPTTRRGYGQPADAPATAASPAVECPDGGGADSAADPDGASAAYGPATLFGGIWPDDAPSAPPSGPLTAEVDCQPGERVTASASVTGPRGVGPGPLLAEEVHSSCTATPDGITTDVRIAGGILETRYDAATQSATETEPVPVNPGPSYTREGTLDHVGDSYRIVFNEQVENADGSVTVNAVRMELLGPTAVGEMVIGSATCGVGMAAAGTPGLTGRSDSADGRSGAGGATDGQSTRGGTGRQLARTGSDPLPVAALGLGLLLAGVLALQGGRRGRAAARTLG